MMCLRTSSKSDTVSKRVLCSRMAPRRGGDGISDDPPGALLTWKTQSAKLLDDPGMPSQGNDSFGSTIRRCRSSRRRVSGPARFPEFATANQKGCCRLCAEKASRSPSPLRTSPYREGGQGYPAPDGQRPSKAHAATAPRWPIGSVIQIRATLIPCAPVLPAARKAVPGQTIGTAQQANILAANSASQSQRVGNRSPGSGKGAGAYKRADTFIPAEKSDGRWNPVRQAR